MIYDMSPEQEKKEHETTSWAENAGPDILETNTKKISRLTMSYLIVNNIDVYLIWLDNNTLHLAEYKYK